MLATCSRNVSSRCPRAKQAHTPEANLVASCPTRGHTARVPDRDTSRPGPIANFVFAAIWLALGIWTIATLGPPPLRSIQLAGYLAMTVLFVVIGVRRLRTRRMQD
jgi:hypothetical protein